MRKVFDRLEGVAIGMKMRLLAAGLAALLLVGCQAKAEDSTALGENQTEQYGKIEDIAGNEITVALGTMQEVEMSQPEAGAADAAGEEGQPAGGPGLGEMGTPPEGMPQGGQDAPPAGMEAGEAPDEEAPAMSLSQFVSSGESVTYVIPVNTTVTRGSGEDQMSANFTMLSVDMVVRMVLEDGVVVSMQIVG